MPSVQRPGMVVHYETAGRGVPLVLLHGLPLTGASWRVAGYLDALADRYRCIMVDARGAGLSGKPETPALHGIDNYLDDVMVVLDELRVRAFAVWGFSRGARVGFALAARYARRVRAVVATGCVGTESDALRDIEDVQRLIEVTKANGMLGMLADWEPAEDPPLPTWFRQMILDYDHRAWIAAKYGGFCWPEIPVNQITAPTLLLVGSREDPDGEAHRWAARLPHGTAATVPDRTHCGTFLASQQCLAEAMPFLDRSASPTPGPATH